MKILRLKFKTINNIFPLDYNPVILSIIKGSLELYDEKLYKQYYKINIMKGFTFNVYIPNALFEKDFIRLSKNEFQLNISSCNDEDLDILSLSFIKLMKRVIKIKDNAIQLMTVKEVYKQDITDKTTAVKFLSPLLVRSHCKEKNQDMYLTYSNEEFERIIKNSIICAAERLNKSIVCDDFKIKPLEPKKIVTRHFDMMINANIGTYLITSNKDVLNFVYAKGLGSHTASGHGMFNLIKQRRDNYDL